MNKSLHYEAKQGIEVVLYEPAMKLFFEYAKKDPMQYIHKIEYEYDDDLCDDVALTHIEDSAKYIHDLRRKNRYE